MTRKRIPAKLAAELMGLEEQTLAVWRCTGRYDLPYYKIGRKVFYLIDDIETFIESRKMEGLKDGRV